MEVGGSSTAEALYFRVNIPREDLDVSEAEPKIVGGPGIDSVITSTEPLWLDYNERVCVRVLRFETFRRWTAPSKWRAICKKTEIKFMKLIEPCDPFAGWTSREDIFRFHLLFSVSDGAPHTRLSFSHFWALWEGNDSVMPVITFRTFWSIYRGDIFLSTHLYSSFQYTDSNFIKTQLQDILACKSGTL